ncbi:MAG: elongation factor P maturation arginine rhamnosyltransferase EarP, partial [Oxalobacter sp.]|nr:elongation factor P maturation arginine rhamnosyltransferase EarP [Oxalobacter sp.]
MGNPTSGKWRADRRIDIFCEVVDNFGDAGVCWRLARHLAKERGCDIRLWIDKPDVLQHICRALNPDLPVQRVCQVTVCRWPGNLDSQTIGQIPDVVIEGFGTR